MALTDTKIRRVKPSGKQLKLFDGGGLFLLVTLKGGKLWRLKYRYSGKEKLLSLGMYPTVSLVDARAKRGEARKLLSDGKDPSAERKAGRRADAAEAETFEAIAREWYGKFKGQWSERHAAAILRRMEADLFPWVSKGPIAEIKAPELLAVLRRIESRGALEIAHRVRTIAGQVFRYAVATGRAERDPSADLRGAIPHTANVHHAAVTDPKDVAALVRAVDGYEGHYIVRCALRLAALLFVRPGELRRAEWAEVDLDGALWNIPAEKMKMKQPHVVPLSRQALQILTDLKQLTGRCKYVFPSVRSFARPISPNTLNAALRCLGYDKRTMTAHGFRAMARTLLDEVLQVRPDFIEHQLGHAVKDPNGRAYNRTTHLEERRKMMQRWADYLDGLKAGAVVVPFKNAQGQ
jgi:integrase